jgi:hypothetical protein
VQLWQSAVEKVSKVLKMGGPSEPKMEGPAFAGFAPSQWDAESVINAGFVSGDAGKLLGTFAEHHYAVSRISIPFF